MEKIVSIIVPIYNKENYLERCFESIIQQKYKDIEIILVNDGSTDLSLSICKQFATKDHRFRIIDKKNGGVSEARNYGLQKCKGDYVFFVDPDDILHQDCIERLVQLIKKFNVNIAACKAYDCIATEASLNWNYKKDEGRLVHFDGMYDFNAPYARYVCWGILFNKAILNKIKFAEDLYVGEDTLFYMSVLMKEKKMAFIESELYCYVQYENSESHGVYNEKKRTEIIAWDRIRDLANSWSCNDALKEGIECQYALRCQKNLLHIMHNKETFYKYMMYIVNYRREMRKRISIVLKGNIRTKSKIKYIIVCLLPSKMLFGIIKLLRELPVESSTK